MAFTIDRSTGANVSVETRVGANEDQTTIYAANGTTVLASLSFEEYSFIRYAPANWGLTSGTTSDTLITGATNDIVFWDVGATDGMAGSNASSQVSDASTRARLYTGADSSDRDFEVFDLGGGNDILNLTYNEGGSGTDPNGYNTSATAYGGAGNDVIALSTAADRAYGGANNDTIFGGGGLDLLSGDAGNDSIFGSTDADSIYGGADSDKIYGGGGLDVLSGDAGNDSIYGSTGADKAYGGTDSDVIYGGGGLDQLWGDAGSVAIDEATGSADTIYSGEGASATLWGEGGNDFLYGSGEGIETFYGGAGNDTIDNISGFGDVAYGGAGNDRIITIDTGYGGTGDDWLDGGYGGTGEEGRDTIYGDAGNDTVFGYDADDKLYGGADADTLYGGTENDQLYFNADATTSGSVKLWAGIGPAVTLSLSSDSYSLDTFFGDDGIDTLLLDDGDNVFVNKPGDLNTGSGFGAAGTSRLVGIEVILAGAGTDIIGLNHQTLNGGDTASIYADNITIAGEDGSDLIFSGSGADLLIGGKYTTGASNGNDTIFGGAGNDTIYGDSRATNGLSEGSGNDVLFGGAGDDTILGGDGDDTIYGGTGNDFAFGGLGNDIIYDDGSANGFMSADGSDLLILNFNNAALNKALSITGLDDNSVDGPDQVFVNGSYASVSFSLGGSNDKFVSSSTGGTGIDRVNGESGDDAISTWQGNDQLDGGSNGDVLWGGAGADTIYGGLDGDYLYGGTGDGDVLVGGAGIDYYYWARSDGDDLIDDNDPGPLPGTGAYVNAIIVFPDFATETTAGSDGLLNGSGVFEADHDLYDNAGGNDMVRIIDVGAPGGTMELHIISGVGAGNSVLTFDQQDISVIALWNNDAAPGTPVVTQYVWDSVDQRYEFTV